jgi:hypothetical protein
MIESIHPSYSKTRLPVPALPSFFVEKSKPDLWFVFFSPADLMETPIQMHAAVC